MVSDVFVINFGIVAFVVNDLVVFEVIIAEEIAAAVV